MTILKFLKSNWKSVIIFAAIVVLFYSLYSKTVARLNSEIERLENNYTAYVNLYDGQLAANNVLKLTEYELKQSKDSLLSELGKYIEENRKLKKIKEPKVVEGITQMITDTIMIEIPVNVAQFDVTKEINSQTKIRVQGIDTILNIIPEISNTLMLEIGINKVYLNSYPSKWSRFWHFDWKKTETLEYNLDQSNDLIKLDDVKIVKL